MPRLHLIHVARIQVVSTCIPLSPSTCIAVYIPIGWRLRLLRERMETGLYSVHAGIRTWLAGSHRLFLSQYILFIL